MHGGDFDPRYNPSDPRSTWPRGTPMADDLGLYLPLRNVKNTLIGYCWIDAWEKELGSPLLNPTCQ